MNKIWNWIKNIFKPTKQDSYLELSEEVDAPVEETAKQKKIRLKHQGDNK
jgi:hypothetical protein